MNTGKTIGRLQALKRAVLADGKVDWNETEQLLAVIRPLAKKHGFLFQDYERLLEKCREDGQITKEESEKLALQLDFLCSFFSNLRLKFWLIVTAVLLLIIAALSVSSRVADSTATFGRPTVLSGSTASSASFSDPMLHGRIRGMSLRRFSDCRSRTRNAR